MKLHTERKARRKPRNFQQQAFEAGTNIKHQINFLQIEELKV
jgi:hypothetical protein